MHHRLFLIATFSFACASTGPAPVFDEEAAVLEVEDSLREAEAMVDAGKKSEARALIASSEARIERELASQPDRHQLLAHAAELRERLNGSKPMLTEAAPEALAVIETPRTEELTTNDYSLTTTNVVAEFEAGPLQDRKRGIKKLASAKRAPKKKKSRLYAEARALLESCANEGGRMVVSSPDLQTKSFTVGAKKRSADWVVVQCKSKVRSIDRRLKKKFRQS